jgi:hypothetical protein
MQIEGWNPILFIVMLALFVIIFWAYLYSRGLMWFQQNNEKRADSWLVTFEERDAASGNWFHRFGRLTVVLFLIHFISYPLVTNLIELTPFQFFLFVVGYYLPSGLILAIVLFIILRRIYKQQLGITHISGFNHFNSCGIGP